MIFTLGGVALLLWAFCGVGAVEARTYSGLVIRMDQELRLEASVDLWFDEVRAIHVFRLRGLVLLPENRPAVEKILPHGQEVELDVYPDGRGMLHRRWSATVYVMRSGLRVLDVNRHLAETGVGRRDE